MKLKNILLLSGALSLGTVALTSCGNDKETFDVFGSNKNLVFFDTNTATEKTTTIYNTPIGVYGTVDGTFSVKAQYGTDATIVLGGEADLSLVEGYNTKHNTTLKALPQQAANALQINNVAIRPGSNLADTTMTVTLPEEACALLTEESYLVPVRLKVLSENRGTSPYEAAVNEDYGTAYVIIKNAAKDFITISDSNVKNVSIAKTPAGVFGQINAKWDFSMYDNKDAEVTVKAEFDNGLITAYNTENKKAYNAVPENILKQLQVTPGKISKGQKTSSTPLTISDPNNASQDLPLGEYVIPIRLTATYSNSQTAPLSNAYIVINVNETLINDNATSFSGSELDNSGWSAVSASGAGLSVANFDNLKNSGYWPFKQKEDDTTFVIDLGGTHNLTGFAITGEAVSSSVVEFSTDNSNWTTVGNTSEHKSVNTGGWPSVHAYVLYGAVPTRYVRVKCKLNTSYWGWSYINESWGARYCSVTPRFYE